MIIMLRNNFLYFGLFVEMRNDLGAFSELFDGVCIVGGSLGCCICVRLSGRRLRPERAGGLPVLVEGPGFMILLVESLTFDFFCYLVPMQRLIIKNFRPKITGLLDFFQELVFATDLEVDEPVLVLVPVQSSMEVGLILLLHLCLVGTTAC